MKAEQLWASILQEAIQGKLVPQLEREPKVDQVQELPEDVPFNIPEKWTWVRLGELVNYGSSEQIEGSKITSSTWVLDLEDVEKNSGKLLQKKYGTKTTSNKSCFKKGDILYGKLRPYLNKVLIADEDGCCSTEIVPINVSSAKLKIDAEFLSYFLRSPYFVGYANSCAYGVKMPRLGTKDAKSAWVAIPPITEQRRIVARLQKIRSLVDAYCHEEIHLSQLITGFPDKLKASILQEAIQGKLVPQLESEPCIELPDSQLSDSTIDIPKKWKWVKLKDIFTFIDYRGKTPNKIHEGVRLITASNIKHGRMDHSKKVFIANEEYLTRQSRGISKKGDILFTTEAPLGNVAIADIDNYSAGQRIITLQSKKGNNELYMYFMLSPYFQKLLVSQATGTTAQGIKAARLKELVIPVPPEGEQERILNKLTALFSFLEIYK